MDFVVTDLRRWLAEDRASLRRLTDMQRRRAEQQADTQRLERRIERCEAWLRVLRAGT